MLNRAQLSRVDLNLLVLFDTVFEERHVGRAADRLHLTPSAVSHGLARLRVLLNDPLFLRTPRGVVPTERAVAIAGRIAEVLALARNVVESARPFDAAVSDRRFTIGAPDAVAAVVVPPLLGRLKDAAPHVDVSVRQLLPAPGTTAPEPAWRSALAELDTGAVDVVLAPVVNAPSRFDTRLLYHEDFVVTMRRGHPLARRPTLDRYCDARHLVVSLGGDPHGFVDDALAREGRSRRVALTMSNFMAALAMLADSDLVSAVPRRLAAANAARFGLTSVELPLKVETNPILAVLTRGALGDAGIAWFLDEIMAAVAVTTTGGSRSKARSSGPRVGARATGLAAPSTSPLRKVRP